MVSEVKKIQVNQFKTNVVHSRKKGLPRTNVSNTLRDIDFKVFDIYRYLGIVFNEYLDFNYVLMSCQMQQEEL